MKPKISVIIPIYDTERYLRKCLDSVINQTFKDIEIICVDDCSPDNSYQVIEEYAKVDNRVRLIRHKNNLGQGGARNTAILAAKADFIASVDSDDSMQINMLESLWEASNDGEFDIVCCGYNRVSEDGVLLTKREFKADVISNCSNEVNIYKLLNPAIWNKLWRKSLFIDNNIYFPNKLYYQDMATIPLLVAKARIIKLIDKCLYQYLVREDSVTNSFTPKHTIDYFKVYEILYDFLQREGLNERYALDLATFINEGMWFHSKNLLESDLNEDDKKQYLRHLLMMKIAFFESYDALTEKSENELQNYLERSVSFKEIVSEETTIFGVVAPFIPPLNIFQKFGVSMYGFLFKRFIHDAQMAKLKKNPHIFFKDSNNKFTYILGRLLCLV